MMGLEGGPASISGRANDGDVIYLISGTGADRQAAVDRAVAVLPSGARARPASVVHATLVLVGGRDNRAVARAKQIGDLMRGAAFQLVFDSLQFFSQSHSAALVCSETPAPFLEIRRQLTQAARSLGNSVEGGNKPHLTMAYDCPSFEPVRLTTPLTWDVTEIQLVHSVHGETRHEEHGRWSLS